MGIGSKSASQARKVIAYALRQSKRVIVADGSNSILLVKDTEVAEKLRPKVLEMREKMQKIKRIISSNKKELREKYNVKIIGIS